MRTVDQLQPRDRPAAARVVFALTAVAVGVTVLFAAVGPSGAGIAQLVITILLSALMLVGAALLRRARGEHRLAWAGFPFVAIAVIVALDLLSHDASASSQAFLFFPVLYGASQLRRGGATSICAVVVIGDLIVNFSLLAPRTALTQSAYLVGALVTAVTLLVLAGERQEELLAQLRRQAAIDPLTGLVTRRVLDSAAHSALGGAATAKGTALILIDVDNFKSVNDVHGHPVGDEVLIQLARLLTGSARASDTVSRMGGDEVAVLMAGCSAEAAVRRAEEILWDVRSHDFAVGAGVALTMSVSIGLAHAPTHAVDLRSLYAAADTSLYNAKRNGRNQIGATVAALKGRPAAA